MNTTTFGALIGVSQSQVSRYELGQAIPGYVPLGRLLQLAEGAEKNPILDRIAELLGKKRDDVTELDAIRELEKTGRYFEPLWNSLPYGGLGPPDDRTPIYAEFRDLMPNFVELLDVFDELCNRHREVDPSLPKILRLWLEHDDTDPAVRERFADAAKFLEVGLSAKTGRVSTTQQRAKKSA
jgi:transcriptional regulator with XRE-family HTH domain